MPGIESRAPERTETSSGFFASPNFLPVCFSIEATPACICALSAGRIRPLVVVVVGADFGGDRETRRHRQADAAHLGEVGALAAEQRLHAAVAVGLALAEEIDVLASFFASSSGLGMVIRRSGLRVVTVCAGLQACFPPPFPKCRQSAVMVLTQHRQQRQTVFPHLRVLGHDEDIGEEPVNRLAAGRRSSSCASAVLAPAFRVVDRSGQRSSISRARAASAGSFSRVRRSASVDSQGRDCCSLVMFLTRLSSAASGRELGRTAFFGRAPRSACSAIGRVLPERGRPLRPSSVPEAAALEHVRVAFGEELEQQRPPRIRQRSRRVLR